MKRTIGILGLAAAMAGCEANQRAETENIRAAVYIKDSRTGLCFLAYWLGSNNGTVTNVPCTEAVEREIAKDAPTCPAK